MECNMRGAIVLLSLVLLVGCDGISNLTDEEYLARAKDFLDENDLPAAQIDLKNAIRKNPKNSQARWLLGNLYLDTGNGPSAEKELRSARELGVADESIVPLLARSLLQQEKYQEVLELDSGSSLSNEAAAELLASRGLAYLLLGENDNARGELDNALRKNPNSAYALVERARLSVNQRNFEEARPYLDKAFEINPDYVFAWSLLGDMNRYENKLEAAIDAYTEAINNTSNVYRDLLRRAMLFIRVKQYEKAQHDVNELKKLLPRHPEVDFRQGYVHLMQKKIPEAQVSFEQCLQNDPGNMLATYYIGIAHLLQGNLEQANRNLSSYVNAYPGTINGRKLLALVKLRQKDFKAAEELIRPVVNEKADDVDALNILADSLMYQGKLDELMPIVEKSTALQPDSASAKTRMGIGLLLQGEEEAGVESLETAIEIDLLLVLNHLQTKSYDKAQQAAEAFAEKQPDKALAHNLVGKTSLARGHEDQAQEAFEKARQLTPGDPYACRNLAILALRRSDTDKARALFTRSLNTTRDIFPPCHCWPPWRKEKANIKP